MAANRRVKAGRSRKGLRVIDPRSSWAVPWFQALPGDVNSAVYIEALLVDPNGADQVWEAWDTGEISDAVAVWA